MSQGPSRLTGGVTLKTIFKARGDEIGLKSCSSGLTLAYKSLLMCKPKYFYILALRSLSFATCINRPPFSFKMFDFCVDVGRGLL